MFSVPVAAGTEPHKHVVQFYGRNDDALAANVSRYLGEGLQRGEGLVVIATAAHIRASRRPRPPLASPTAAGSLPRP